MAGISDEGVNIAQIIAATIAGGRCSEQEVRIVIADLETESEIYSTIDANPFKISVQMSKNLITESVRSTARTNYSLGAVFCSVEPRDEYSARTGTSMQNF